MSPHQRQHGVTIGNKRYTVDQDGKFHLADDEQEDQD